MDQDTDHDPVAVFFCTCFLSYQITQYSTRPTKLGKKKDDMSFDDVSIPKLERLTFFLFSQDDDDDVVISLCSRDPQAVKVRRTIFPHIFQIFVRSKIRR